MSHEIDQDSGDQNANSMNDNEEATGLQEHVDNLDDDDEYDEGEDAGNEIDDEKPKKHGLFMRLLMGFSLFVLIGGTALFFIDTTPTPTSKPVSQTKISESGQSDFDARPMEVQTPQTLPAASPASAVITGQSPLPDAVGVNSVVIQAKEEKTAPLLKDDDILSSPTVKLEEKQKPAEVTPPPIKTTEKPEAENPVETKIIAPVTVTTNCDCADTAKKKVTKAKKRTKKPATKTAKTTVTEFSSNQPSAEPQKPAASKEESSGWNKLF